MGPENQSGSPTPGGGGDGDQFASTSWSVVLAAGGNSASARQALEALCQRYWHPLYAYLRRRGYPAEQAEDLTQGFFLMFLERQNVARLNPQKGRFRSYLLTSLQHYVADEHSRADAAKRGGARAPFSLDLRTAEGRYALEPFHDVTPERLFDRRWAMSLIDLTLDCLRKKYRDEGKEPLFDALEHCLVETTQSPSHAQTAAELGISEGAVKVAAHRLRQRFGKIMRAAVADTVADEGEVDGELRDILACLSS
jgi:RNA polymerase sigma factor (sigma-70 family)